MIKNALAKFSKSVFLYLDFMINIVWLRRDLRIEDNTALHYALENYDNVQPIFIFDKAILSELPVDDARVNFISDSLEKINQQLKEYNSSILCFHGEVEDIFSQLIHDFDVNSLHFNRDYEPYAIKRDNNIQKLFKDVEIKTFSYKDHVIFEKDEIVKADQTPYTVYTPYKNKWLNELKNRTIHTLKSNYNNFNTSNYEIPELYQLGFEKSSIKVKPYTINQLDTYSQTRDFPSLDNTSYLSPHLRFGTVSIRQIILSLKQEDTVFLSELIWREFFTQILAHFPQVQSNNFKAKYNGIEWRNNKDDFKKWCNGETGYPIVDAGMRQLNQTGYMHNRVRMITAGFLCKHLLIDWKWGEAYFAKKLLDYDLAANNGNWQWSAGTGCDSAPYFRIFNPTEQIKKFDKNLTYIRTWVKDFDELTYPQPMVEHKFARERCLKTYKEGLS